MQCPICSSPMMTIDHSGVALDQCTSCRALWFDRTEFAAAMEHDVPSVTIQWGRTVKDRAGTAHACPRDRRAMKVMEWDDIPFERCPGCSGVLLTEHSWKLVHEAAEARAAGKKFAVFEALRDLFQM